MYNCIHVRNVMYMCGGGGGCYCGWCGFAAVARVGSRKNRVFENAISTKIDYTTWKVYVSRCPNSPRSPPNSQMSPSYDIGKIRIFLLLDETFLGRPRTRRRGVSRPLTGHPTVPRVRGCDNITHTEHIWPFWSPSVPSGHIHIVNLLKLRFKKRT